MRGTHLFVSGSIGVGKSTVVEQLKIKLNGCKNVYFVKEYIDFDPEGKQKLEDSLNDKLSLFEFQKYILDCFDKQLKNIVNENSSIIIWERHPIEAIDIFAKTLTLSQKRFLKDFIYKELHVPKLNSIRYVNSYDTYYFPPNIIADELYQLLLDSCFSNNHFNIWVLLKCSRLDEQIERIILRNRSCEVDKILSNKDYLPDINALYENFFSNLYLDVDYIINKDEQEGKEVDLFSFSDD